MGEVCDATARTAWCKIVCDATEAEDVRETEDPTVSTNAPNKLLRRAGLVRGLPLFGVG